MKAHLALKCSDVTQDIKLKYLKLIKFNNTQDEQQNNNNNNNLLDPQRILKINQAMVRFFVCCGIPFCVADSPFFIDFIKSISYNYEPPKRTTLSGHLLDSEIADVTLKMEEEIRHSKNLTLGKYFN
jgi:hypothetical protein